MKKETLKICRRIFFLLAFPFSIAFINPANAHSPSWTDGIACIIYSHCTSCHNQNGIAPFPLETYNDVYQNRFAIAASVQARSMPPFPASQDKQRYAHANTLTQHEIDEITDWVSNFAPLGNANNIPPSPVFSSGYQLQNPDFTGQIPAYTVTSNTDEYRMFVIPVNNTAQQTIQSIEVFPGNRQIVHHALVFQDTSSVPLNLDLSDPLPGYAAFGGTGSPSSKLLTVYTPGQGAFNFPPGFGAVMLPNTFIILQMHYPGGVSGQVDSTQIRLKYGPANLRNVSTSAVLNHHITLQNGPLFIPADSVKTFYSQLTNNFNRTLTGIMPHMHLIGTSIKAYGITPNNDTIHLVDIPEWDFHWQYFYQFPKPVLIPAGTVLYGEATYDNTVNNPNNPNFPPQDVARGEGTEDEMFLIYMNFSNYQSGDTNIVVDTSAHYVHDISCNLTTGVAAVQQEDLNVFPNPFETSVQIQGLDKECTVTVFNGEGKPVFTCLPDYEGTVDLRALAIGIYYLEVRTADRSVYYRKIVKS